MAYVNSLLLFTFIISYLWTTTALNSTCILSEDTSWMNNNQSLPSTIHFTDGSVSRFIFLRERQVNGSQFGFGLCFFCTTSSGDACFYLSMVFVEMSNGMILPQPPQVIWSANRDKPVGEDAILSFSRGSLELSTTNEFGLWSTYTTGLLVHNLRITKEGNLVLFNLNDEIVWQSFDHFTDTLVDGQKLRIGRRLTSNISSKTMRTGMFYATIYGDTLSAFVGGDKPRRYVHVYPNAPMKPGVWWLESVRFRKGKIIFFYVDEHDFKKINVAERTSNSSTVQILRMDADGGLRIHGWEAGRGWTKVYAFTSGSDNECVFPLFCGRYGVCRGGNCSCPVGVDGVQYFIPTDNGCRQIFNPPSLGTSDYYQLVNFGNLSYYDFIDKNQAIQGIANVDTCTIMCAITSSCEATIFIYEILDQKGYCYFTEDVLSLTEAPASSSSYSSTHIKVLVHRPPSISLIRILLAVSPFVLALLISILVCMSGFKKKQNDDCQDFESDETLKLVLEFPMRFSYRELSIATANFSEKLGGGGFGTVFKGVLKNGTVVAVKRLDRSGQGTKEFLAEVQTLGNIHHINLVRLIGFCATKSHRMLVYEYMSNGSLDRRIFCESQDDTLGWNIKKKILADIAKGLTYLHEECTQKIAHLDVKPQNILLDDNFNAKLSDFGLSKLISRDDSQVVTGIRGTLGYLAPEWQHSRITVKADIYSFGIVLLEIISGRKILDYSQPDSDVHLLSVFRKKASENRLTDMVECKDGDKEGHIEDAIEMIKLGMWCLNGDYTRRPSMSLVVKILEGVIPLEMNGH